MPAPSSPTAALLVSNARRDTPARGAWTDGACAPEPEGAGDKREDAARIGIRQRARADEAERREPGDGAAEAQGGDERANGEVQIKDLIAGAKAAEAITDNTEWRESRPAQFSVKESELVEAVKKVLADQNAEREA